MRFPNFKEAIDHATWALLEKGEEVDAGSWQGYKTEGRPDLITKEFLNLQLEVPVDRPVHQRYLAATALEQLQQEIRPNLPWADAHFDERVSGNPSNPGEQYKNWPWWGGDRQAQAAAAVAEAYGYKFSHTYQERFWPKEAGDRDNRDNIWPREGIRYKYGDLDDVVNLLALNPGTRQATFPIFFPEDTGAVHGGRIPCTLHYHFLLREDKLHMWYPIRSCDLVRHFRDDLYMACRLLIWVLEGLQHDEHNLALRELDTPQVWCNVQPGTLFFTAYSFHVHKGDLHHVQPTV